MPPKSASTTALILAYAGAIPFVGLAIALWLAPIEHRSTTLQALTTYAAVVLSFLGGIQWGVAVKTHQDAPKSAQTMFLLSVIPSLLAWAVLFLPSSGARLIVAIFLFGFVWLIDALLNLQKLIPPWFFRVRSIVTLIVIASLVVALMAVG